MSWILLLISSPDIGSPITSSVSGFKSEKACLAAGKEWMDRVTGGIITIPISGPGQPYKPAPYRYSCVSAGDKK